MNEKQLNEHAAAYLHQFCVAIDSRRVGSAGNHAAADFFAATLATYGFAITCPSFACMDWVAEGAMLAAADQSFTVYPSPYAPGCRITAPLQVVTTVAELAAATLTDHIVLLQDEIAAEQLMPKNFPFYNPEHHQYIIQLLEAKQPQAIITATSRDTAMVGGMYPFPLIEDGDFDIPSVYMTDIEGERLAPYAGQIVALESRAQRIPATGYNVVARKGQNPARRVVLFAHLDAKPGTPGATDNASGLIVLLLLGELLAEYKGDLEIELVALNGEDYFSAPGEQLYLAQNRGRFQDILLGINIDGAGFHQGGSAYSLYECSSDLTIRVQTALGQYAGLVPGEPWYQGDHSLFLMNGVPALAFTSEALGAVMQLTHTSGDNPYIVDPAKLTTLALAIHRLLMTL